MAVLDWSTFIQNRWHTIYDRLAFRKLRGFSRTLEVMQKLEKFIRDSIGKKYKLSATKIFTKQAATSCHPNSNSDTSYFCSELVASAYQCIKLLPTDLAAS